MQVFRHGEFKSAVEPFTRTDMSESAKLQTETYVNSMWNHLSSNVAKSRNLTIESLNETADQFPMMKSGDFLIQAGLLDGLKYKDEVINELKDFVDIDYSKDLNAINQTQYAKAYVPGIKKGIPKNKIAVIYAEGAIDGGDTGGIVSDDLSRTIRQARRDTTIKAVVLRINSPGGSALGSEIIWREVKLTTESKPVIVSMSDLAASGGYYIACAADTIVAQPNTLTGSIGVFGLMPNVKGLFEKIGITTDGVKTNKFADMPALDRPFTPEEKQLMQAFVENTYDLFLQRCADGRDTTKAAIDNIGEGRVWSGENALDIELVDVLGGMDIALEIAGEKAGLEDFRVVELPELLPPFEQLVKDLTGDASAYFRNMLWGHSEHLEILKTINELEQAYPIQARMPYDISVN
jgi:protease-4